MNNEQRLHVCNNYINNVNVHVCTNIQSPNTCDPPSPLHSRHLQTPLPRHSLSLVTRQTIMHLPNPLRPSHMHMISIPIPRSGDSIGSYLILISCRSCGHSGQRRRIEDAHARKSQPGTAANSNRLENELGFKFYSGGQTDDRKKAGWRRTERCRQAGDGDQQPHTSLRSQSTSAPNYSTPSRNHAQSKLTG